MHFRFALPLLLLASPALAVDFSQPLINPEDGKPFCDTVLKEGEECAPDKILTLGRLAKIALYFNDQSTDGEMKYKRGELAQSLTGATDVKLKKEEREMIKAMIGKALPTLYTKPVWDLLDK